MRRSRPKTRCRASRKAPWFLMGALVSSATLSARTPPATEPPQSGRARAAGHSERRFDIPSRWLEAAVAPYKVWTPSETAPLLFARDQAVAPQPQTRAIDIPPGQLATVLEQFEKLTGVRVTVPDEGMRLIASPGVRGVQSAEQALRALLEGTGIGFRFTAPNQAALELRVEAERVDVRDAMPRPRSPKFTEPVRDTPQTITVIPQTVIAAQGATTLRDVLRNVPGITYQAGEGGGGLPGDTLTMRGFSASNDIFVDGVRDSGAYSRDAFNLEQVEVVKGPASSYAGRGSTGGAINLSTKTPSLRPFYAGTVGAGNAEYKRGTIDVNQPLRALGSGSALRLNAMWTDAGVPGRDVVTNESWAFAPSFATGLDGRTQLTVSSSHIRQNNVPDYGIPWAGFEATPGVDQSNFYGLRNYDYEDIESDAATVQVGRQMQTSITLRNVSRYSRTDRDSAITAPRPPNRQLQQRTMGSETLANQTTLSSSVRWGRTTHAIVAGVDVAREDTDNRNRSQTANQPPTSLYDPDPSEVPLGPVPANTGNPSAARTATVGAYVFDTAHVTDRLLLSGGLRWDRSEVDYRSTDLATGQLTELARTDRMVSWRGGVVFKPRPEGSLYVGAGTSFNPSADAGATGTALSGAPTAVNSVNLEPERSRNLEAGIKWDVLGARLSLAAAVFRTEKTNARTRNLTNDPFVLSGRHRVDGVELSASGTLTSRWTLFAGYAYMDSEIVASANPLEQENDLALVPESSLSVWTTYELRRGIAIGGGTQYVDNVFRNTLNTLAVPGYWLVNGMASYAVNEHLTLRLNLNNLGDKAYVDRVGGGHYIPGPRRAIVLGSALTF